MKIGFRVDSSGLIGSGHVHRCLSLANELRSRGHRCVFFCRNHENNVNRIIHENDYEVFELKNPVYFRRNGFLTDNYKNWLGVSNNDDIMEVLSGIGAEKFDYIVVDHYSISADWMSKARISFKKVLLIDDIINRSSDADVIINQNITYDNESNVYYLLNKREFLALLGPKYAILNSTFRKRRVEAKEIEEKNKKSLLITNGMLDIGSLALKATKTLAKNLVNQTVDLIVAIGSSSPNIAELTDIANKYSNVLLHIDARNLAELMAFAQFGIGGGGTTNWERCCMGLPVILYSVAENQTLGASRLAEAGAAIYLGRVDELDTDELVNTAISLLYNPSRLKQMSAAAAALCDGLGAVRIVDIMTNGVNN